MVQHPWRRCVLVLAAHFLIWDADSQAELPAPASSPSSTSAPGTVEISAVEQVVSLPAGSLPRNRCCWCKYEPIAVCEGIRKKSVCEKTFNPESETLDCVWQNKKCVSRFKKECDDFEHLLYKPGSPNSQCDTWVTTDKEGTAASVFTGKQCTSTAFYQNAHGEGCDPAMEDVFACVSTTGSSCTAQIESCAVFQDRSAVERWAQTFQSTLPEGCSVTIRAQQATCSNTVRSDWMLTITPTEIQNWFIHCHDLGTATLPQFCFETNETLRCWNDETRKPEWRRCCPTNSYLPPSKAWMPAPEGAPCPGQKRCKGKCRLLQEEGDRKIPLCTKIEDKCEAFDDGIIDFPDWDLDGIADWVCDMKEPGTSCKAIFGAASK